jgi:hypothetical protein
MEKAVCWFRGGTYGYGYEYQDEYSLVEGYSVDTEIDMRQVTINLSLP